MVVIKMAGKKGKNKKKKKIEVPVVNKGSKKKR